MTAPFQRHRLLAGLVTATIVVGLTWWSFHALHRDEAVLSPAQVERLATRGTFMLVSLDPELGRRPEQSPETDRWHDWLELGRTTIPDAAPRRKLLEALRSDLSPPGEGAAAACFWPRHGIHWHDGNEQLDFVICYYCEQFIVYPRKSNDTVILASVESESLFDQMLTTAGVRLAPKGK